MAASIRLLALRRIGIDPADCRVVPAVRGAPVKFDIDLTIKYEPEREKYFGEILAKLDKIAIFLQSFEVKTMSALSDLQDAVTKQDSVIDSAVTLLTGLKAALDKAGTDPAALKALSTDMGAKTQALADALVANTPAAEGEPPAAA